MEPEGPAWETIKTDCHVPRLTLKQLSLEKGSLSLMDKSVFCQGQAGVGGLSYGVSVLLPGL